MSEIQINNHKIGAAHPAYVIAELSANHNQNFNTALKLVKAAKSAGADAVKLQTYTADTLTADCSNSFFFIKGGTPWDKHTLHELYKQTCMPWSWQPKLKVVAEKLGLDFFSSAYDKSSIDFLQTIDVPAYKLSSFEITDLPLIENMAKTGKPLIISTGMATLDEISEAVQTAKNSGATQFALLKCTSAYPTDVADLNLKVISDLACAFNVPVGLSDHTLSTFIPSIAVALGGCIIEKHLTLSRKLNGPDDQFSLEPVEFKRMVKQIRLTEKTLGSIKYGPVETENASLAFRRSIFVLADMKKGDVFNVNNVKSIRPAFGISPKYYKQILGLRCSADIVRGTPLTWDLVADSDIEKIKTP